MMRFPAWRTARRGHMLPRGGFKSRSANRRLVRSFALPVLAFLVVTGCLGAGQDAPPQTPTVEPEIAESSRGESLLFKDAIQAATPLTPYKKEFPFDVGPAVLEVRVNLTWSSQASDIQLQLLDLNGENQGTGVKETPVSRGVATVDPPTRGAWKLVVTSTRAVQESYNVNLTLTDYIPGTNHLTQAVNLAARGFAEINLIMEDNSTFDYAFTTREGTLVKYNIHSHVDGVTKYHVEGTEAKANGTFAAPHRQIYSIMWENEAVTPVTLDLKLDGQFRVHSHN